MIFQHSWVPALRFPKGAAVFTKSIQGYGLGATPFYSAGTGLTWTNTSDPSSNLCLTFKHNSFVISGVAVGKINST